jgi:circadian clock protein KaiC
MRFPRAARVRGLQRFHAGFIIRFPKKAWGMSMGRATPSRSREAAGALPKAPTGIAGLDEITFGGLPRGRPTLICGSAGCGKSLFGMEFLLHGVLDYKENGVYVSFEETPDELAQNVRSLGFEVEKLIAQNKLAIDYVHIERTQIEEAGEFDLEGLFVRLALAIDSVGAKRVVLDTIEALFGGFSDQALLRSELRRLFRFLKDKGVTAVITGERGDGQLTRQGLEEYVSDCVILLDHRVVDQTSTRRIRVVKYRGTTHGTNEYPFLISARGISVLPLTSLGLNHAVSNERISTGIPRLDAMLGGKGFYRGSSILISGTAGSGKSSFSAHFANQTCRRGEKCLYLAFEESQPQIVRNMRSIGIDLEPWLRKGLLQVHASRPTAHGLETHLAQVHDLVNEFAPHVVIIDPISNLPTTGSAADAEAMLLRLVDFLKSRGITALLVNLTAGGAAWEHTDVGISSLIDTWILLRDIELGGERNRAMYILKSRGMKHSNQIREFILTSEGIRLEDVYIGPEGVLTGSMRAAQEARERAEAASRLGEAKRKQRELTRRRAVLEAQITALRTEFEAVQEEAAAFSRQSAAREEEIARERAMAARRRGADDAAPRTQRRGNGR